jgi:hypothetical protein
MERYVVKSHTHGILVAFDTESLANSRADLINAPFREKGLPDDAHVVDTGQPKPKRTKSKRPVTGKRSTKNQSK